MRRGVYETLHDLRRRQGTVSFIGKVDRIDLKVDDVQRKATRAIHYGKVGVIPPVLGFLPDQVISPPPLAFHEEPQQGKFCRPV